MKRVSVSALAMGLWAAAMAMLTPAATAPAEELNRSKDQDAKAFAAAVHAWSTLDPNVAANLARFIHAYPEEILGVEGAPGKAIQVKLRNGTMAPFADTKPKDFAARLTHCNVNEMLFDAYPPSLENAAWPEDLDPGRYRCTEFFKAVYGGSEKEVAGNLTHVHFCGHNVTFNKRNGAAAALAKVGEDLEGLEAKDPALRPYLKTLGGTFAWRAVDGTDQLSAHSFGIAIDLNPDLGGYWRWEKHGLGEMKRRTAYPASIIAAFERHGFIWGGKWYHFDLMHFEFRPEFMGHNSYAQAGQPEPVLKTERDGASPADGAAPPLSHGIRQPASATSASEGAGDDGPVLAFGLDVYRHLAATSRSHGGEENLVMAPASLYRSLEVLRWLAAGETETELLRLLHLAPKPRDVQFVWPALPPDFGLRQAVSVWAPASVDLPDAAVRGMVALYDTESHCIPFDPPSAAVKVLNAWATDHAGESMAMVQETDFPSGAQLAVLSAFQCRTCWAEPFSPAHTLSGTFQSLEGTEIPTAMMHGTMIGGWLRRPDGLMAVSLPLRQSALDFVILLPPHGREGLAELEGSLTAEFFRSLTSSLKPGLIQASLPRVILQRTSRLERTLKALGTDRLFEGAELPRLGKEGKAQVTHLIQHAAIVLDEGGAGNAAATAPETHPDPSIPITEVVVDRPFVFAIVDTSSHLPLVIGRLAHPGAP